MIKIAPVAEVKAQFSAYIRESEDGPVIVTRYGKPVAVLLTVDSEEELERLVLAYSPKFRTLMDASRRQIREAGGISHDEFWQEAEDNAGEAP